ncbi:ribosome biogenesis GTPase YlqF [Xylanibacillus composti]|uniref:Ribosome biogenesis GTPase A n=1 Tax=Xylanibacillus composti TaxID=1572762 RepID=A0A8J4H395_9BACL|nr:ribosome biogenesis GTPase YlqF [Xylanibacillus composti]MDT9724117.1 ribosome biogenesis GTPase YlqF [Xylanibacillus composti]GIQ68667.1 ribosome biogenesis GTPase A [Xylanibacillus composti]
MSVQWFPGHMAKARRQIEEKLKLIDLVIELLDARIPLASRNPMIDQILKNKPRLVLLNKADLADPEVTARWVEAFAQDGLSALPIDASSGKEVAQIVPKSKERLKEKREAQLRKGINPRAMRALIVGIPNVGKSTLINRMAGRSIAATGDRPGVTKAQAWIKVGTEMELLDTPGILWPKFEDEQVGIRLAATGAIKDEILNVEDIAFHTTKYLLEHYPDMLKERYDLDELPTVEQLEEPDQVVAVMEAVGRRRGCLQAGGMVNLEKASQALLRDLRSGRLGRISFETP